MKRFCFLLLSSMAFGQGVILPTQQALKVVNGIMSPVANATITVCAGNASGIPCTPVLPSALFKDAALTQPLTNPFTSDANGNYVFAIAPGNYTVTVTAATFVGYSYQTTAPVAGSGNNTFSGSNTFSGVTNLNGGGTFGSNNTFTGNLIATAGQNSLAAFNINGIIQVDGVKYSGAQALQSAIQACVNPCTVDARNPAIGTQTFTLNPFTNIPITIYTGPYTVQVNTASVTLSPFSHFHWIADGTSLVSTAPFVANNSTALLVNQTFSTTGSITSGTATLTVASATGAEIGTLAAVLGAQGPETKQSTTINQGGGIGTGDASFTVTSVQSGGIGWSLTRTNYLRIDSEDMSCTGATATTFTGCSRGLFGTTAATHLNGATINALPYFLARITNVAGTTLTLDSNASATVTSAPVIIGEQDIRIDGTLLVDGLTNGSTDRGLQGIFFNFATKSYIGPQVKVQNADESGVAALDSWDNYIAGSYQNNSEIVPGGCDVFVFSNSNYNTVRTVSHRHGSELICIDDRSNLYSEANGPSSFNSAILGPVLDVTSTYGSTAGHPAVDIEASSSSNDVYAPYVKTAAAGFGAFIISAQWTTNPTPHGNKITFGFIDTNGGTPLQTSAYTPGTPTNMFSGGSFTGTPSLLAGEPFVYTFQTGLQGNAYAFSFTRSAGAAGFPDLTGNGSSALVIGDANGVKFGTGAASGAGFFTQTIASGTATMTTAAITAPACGTTVTVAAANVATTDTITWAFNAAPAGTNAGIVAWPTSGNVNFAYCPGVTETPAAATINWKVVR